LVQQKDDLPYNFPMTPHSDFVLQGDPLTDHCLDIRITHDSVELRMMEVFQEVDSKNFDSSIFLLITGEVSCSKFQPTVLTDFLSSKHMNSSFCLRRFYDWLHWRVDNVDISRITNHLAAWLHWSFEYID